MDYGRPELADRLAAEFVAGTLRGAARQRFETLLPAHANLRGAVRAWQDRLMPLTLAIEPQQPSPEVWKRIEQRIGTATNAQQVKAPERSWRQLAFWRGLAGLASAAAVALAVVVVVPQPAQPPIVVVLGPAAPPADGGAAPSFVASISPDGRSMVTRPIANVRLESNRSLELWAVPKARPGQAAEAPRSLGLVAPDGATVVQRGKVLDDVDALALSLEPRGGSPTGKPTGPILYVGKLPPAPTR